MSIYILTGDQSNHSVHSALIPTYRTGLLVEECGSSSTFELAKQMAVDVLDTLRNCCTDDFDSAPLRLREHELPWQPEFSTNRMRAALRLANQKAWECGGSKTSPSAIVAIERDKSICILAVGRGVGAHLLRNGQAIPVLQGWDPLDGSVECYSDPLPAMLIFDGKPVKTRKPWGVGCAVDLTINEVNVPLVHGEQIVITAGWNGLTRDTNSKQLLEFIGRENRANLLLPELAVKNEWQRHLPAIVHNGNLTHAVETL